MVGVKKSVNVDNIDYLHILSCIVLTQIIIRSVPGQIVRSLFFTSLRCCRIRSSHPPRTQTNKQTKTGALKVQTSNYPERSVVFTG